MRLRPVPLLLPAILAALGAAALPSPARAQSSLFYLELQGVAAWSTAAKKIQAFSMMPEDPMQTPSVGFDWVRRITGKERDLGALALQARLAYDPETDRPALQVYNAWVKVKAGFSDVWAGHNRPAWGLSSYFDTHGLLLQPLSMYGFGFDRDWGVGFAKDLPRGSFAASLTTGSGMALKLEGNYLAAARYAVGIPGRDPLSVGFSAAAGRILEESMGGEDMGGEATGPEGLAVAGVDAAYFWRNVENRAEIMVGRKAGAPAFAAFWRLGVFFLEEGRLRLDLQPVVTRQMGEWDTSVAAGVSYQATADLAVRGMVMRDSLRHDTRFVVQVYWYGRV